MVSFTTVLATFLFVVHSFAVTYPTTVEFDIFSPQPNASYKKGSTIPIVVAVQNADAAALLNYSFSFSLRKVDNRSYDAVSGGTLDSSDFRYAVGTTAVAPSYFSLKYGEKYANVDMEGEFVAIWYLVTAATCDTNYNTSFSGEIFFTVSKTASQPDLATAVAQDCTAFDIGNLTSLFNMNGTLDRLPHGTLDGERSCQDLGPLDTTPDPCKVKIGDDLVTTISKDIKEMSVASSLGSAWVSLSVAMVGWIGLWILDV